MAEWDLLSRLLDKVQSHSTVIGKVWLTVLFVFRIMVLRSGADEVWGDEQSDFVCNTNQPGCENVCYDQAFPISHVRFWTLQIIAVATPKLLYLGHVLHVIHAEKKMKERMRRQSELEASSSVMFLTKPLKVPKYTLKSSGAVSIRGRLLRSYALHLLAKLLLEAAFVAGQYFLFGFTLETRHVCARWPCPHRVDCFLSRPTEKSVIIWFMLGSTAVSLLLCAVELLYLGAKAAKECAARRRDYTVTPVTPPAAAGRRAFNGREVDQNGVNLELEGRREGEGRGQGKGANGVRREGSRVTAKTVPSEDHGGEVHL